MTWSAGAQFLLEESAGKKASRKSTTPGKRVVKDYHFATAGEKGGIRVWSSAKGRCIAEQEMPGHVEEGSQLVALEISKNGKLMSATEDSQISIVAVKVQYIPLSI